jgi:hypothetical protein
MSSGPAMPVLLGLVVLLLISLVVWGLVRSRDRQADVWPKTHDELLLGLLVLAAFIAGAFLTYIFLGLRF